MRALASGIRILGSLSYYWNQLHAHAYKEWLLRESRSLNVVQIDEHMEVHWPYF